MLAILTIRCQKNDRGDPALVAFPQDRRRLETVQVSHSDIQNENRELLLLEQPFQRLPAGMGFHQMVSGVLQDRLQRQQVFWTVIHQKDIHSGIHAWVHSVVLPGPSDSSIVTNTS